MDSRASTLRDIKSKYDIHLKTWTDDRIVAELSVVNNFFSRVAHNPEEVEWYTMLYNYLEEELIRRQDG